MARWRWLIAQLTRRLWLRASLIGGLGILAAILAAVVERYIPWDMPFSIGFDAVNSLLTIIASSMLSVAIFSLSTMVSAYGAAANQVTPRATKLLVEDPFSQNVLSTFIGSYLFGMVGLVVLKTGAYGDRGRVVLFVMTILVIALVVVALLRWVHYLTNFGRVGETTDRVERAAREAIEMRLESPHMGGRSLRDLPRGRPAGARAIPSDRVGYVQNIDMPALSDICRHRGAEIALAVVPGAFVHLGAPLGWVFCNDRGDSENGGDDGDLEVLAQAFAIGDERSFYQDPRFGLAVLTEIACRALSPAVNDNGTAIDVIGRQCRLLSLWATGATERPAEGAAQGPRYPELYVPPLEDRDLFDDAFTAIARDSAALIEVQLRLHKALLALADTGPDDFRRAARAQASLAFGRAQAEMRFPPDLARLQSVVEQN